MKIRLINDMNKTKYPSLRSCLTQALSENGISTLFKGLKTSTTRAFLVNGCELGTYDQSKELIASSTGLAQDNIITLLISAFMAGLVSAVVSSPVDVCNTRYNA